MILLKIALFIALGSSASAEFLRIEGKDFYYGNKKVFLSGANFAWNSYGYDFGNNNYPNSGPVMEQWIREIAAAGGNTLRIWVHVEGMDTPQFNADGFVTAPDNLGNFISDLERFLDVAQENDVFVILCLWNGAVMTNANFINLVYDASKLDSYIQNVLRPIVRRLASKPALGAWEVINEAEGSVRIESNPNPCFDTTKIGQFGAGWTGLSIPMQWFLRFINRQNAAIRQEDPKALITASGWSEHSQNNAFDDSVDHYTDACLIAGGGEPQGTIDFYQMHTYSWEGSWGTNAPFKVQATQYNLTKPLVIGEFAADCAENEGVDRLWDYGYNSGYNGLWSWQYNAGGHCSDTRQAQNQGMTRIRNYTHNGEIPVNIE